MHTSATTISDQLAKPVSSSASEQEVETRFRRSGYLALSDVSCEVDNGEACLRGCLPSHYLKQVAQNIVGEVAGVHRVVNLIQVVTPAERPPVGCDHATPEPAKTWELTRGGNWQEDRV